MSIDPKKGGQCWSCRYCEDIATQTDNEAGSYYRKCTKDGHDYVDTCKFHCSDYVWDGEHDEFFKSSVSPSASSHTAPHSSASSKSTSKPAPAVTRTAGFKAVAALLTTAVFGFIGYLLLMYAEYVAAVAVGGTPTLPLLNSDMAIESIIVFGPFVLSVMWSIIRRRKIWIGALLTMLACTVINGMIGENTTPAHMPLFIASVAVPYLLCLLAILKEKKD